MQAIVDYVSRKMIPEGGMIPSQELSSDEELAPLLSTTQGQEEEAQGQ